MKETIEAIEKATGTVWHALVFHQVLIGLGTIIATSIVLYVLFLINKKMRLFSSRNINGMIVVGFIGFISILTFGYGVLHVINPGYYALHEGLSMIKP